MFEDVHFDFDRYSLRPEATRALDEAIKSLQDNPQLRIEVEGHTCNIGTAEYNLALGERRANAVARLPDEPRHRRRSPAHRQLRRGAAEARQLARGDAPPQSSRGDGGSRPAVGASQMRFVHLYLVGYAILVVGALAALWNGGILAADVRRVDRDRSGDRGGPRRDAGDHGRQAGHHSRIGDPTSSRPDNGRGRMHCDTRPFFLAATVRPAPSIHSGTRCDSHASDGYRRLSRACDPIRVQSF